MNAVNFKVHLGVRVAAFCTALMMTTITFVGLYSRSHVPPTMGPVWVNISLPDQLSQQR